MDIESRYVSPEEYLELERQAESKSEYLDGRIIAREQANESHSLLQSSLLFNLASQARTSGCRLYSSDMRLKIPARCTYTYPDLSIVCGEFQFEDSLRDILLNPTVIIEILSPSSAMYDRTEKFARYRTIPTLREYLLIAQDSAMIEHFVRQQDEQWLWSIAEHLTDTVELPSVGCSLALADLYADIALG